MRPPRSDLRFLRRSWRVPSIGRIRRRDPTVRDGPTRHDGKGVGSRRGSLLSTGSGVSPVSPGFSPPGRPRSSVIAFCTLMLTVEPLHFLGSVVGTTPLGPVDGSAAGSCAATASTAHSGSRTHRSRVNSSRRQQLYRPSCGLIGWSGQPLTFHGRHPAVVSAAAYAFWVSTNDRSDWAVRSRNRQSRKHHRLPLLRS